MPGQFSNAELEGIALDRMARLRQHQLLHAELVTEGMNRLAQALVCLTDPLLRAAYDAELGFAQPLATVAPIDGGEMRVPRASIPTAPFELVPDDPISADDGPMSSDVTQVIEIPFVAGMTVPETLPPAYELVETESTEALPPAYEVVLDTVVDADFIAPASRLWQPANKRELYSRLAAIRGLLEVWQRFKPMLGNPNEPLDRPIRVLAFLESVEVVRPLLDSTPDLVGEPWQPGGMVVALIRQKLAVSAFRALLPDQRRAIATDWRGGEAQLRREYVRLRELSRSDRKFRRRFRPRGRVMRMIRFSTRHPEMLLLLMVAAIAIAALIRRGEPR